MIQSYSKVADRHHHGAAFATNPLPLLADGQAPARQDLQTGLSVNNRNLKHKNPTDKISEIAIHGNATTWKLKT